MSMSWLNRTSTVIEDCEAIVMNSAVTGSPIESYLVQHALVVLCAEMQQEIYKIVRQRADQTNDQQLSNFISKAAGRVLRSVGKTELAGFVGLFGQNEKEKFNQLLNETAVTKYNNAVNNRHDVAHKSGVQVTFSELKEAVVAASGILQAIVASLEKVDNAMPLN